MNLPGPTELIIVLVIIVLLFGVGRITKIAGEMGSGIRAFKKGISDDDAEKKNGKEVVEEDSSSGKL